MLSGQDLIYIRLIAKYDNSEMVGVAELFFGGDKENLQEITFLVRDKEIEKIFIYLYTYKSLFLKLPKNPQST